MSFHISLYCLPRLVSPIASLAYVMKRDPGAIKGLSPSRGVGAEDMNWNAVASSVDVVDGVHDPHVFLSLTLTPQLFEADTAVSVSDVRPRAPGVDNKFMDHAKAWEAKYCTKQRPVRVRYTYFSIHRRTVCRLCVLF